MSDKTFVIGIDEVGRGPLAGPITVGAVAMPESFFPKSKHIFRAIKDSKKLSAKDREIWYFKLIQNDLLFWATASIDQKTIDKQGISFAAKRGVALAIRTLKKKVPYANFKMIYLDGSLFAPSSFKQKTIIRGDEKVPVIAAASIIAKVTRDRLMVAYSKKWPQYGFERHKGYGTRFHYEAIRKYGITSLHRKSFMRTLKHS